MEWLLLAGAFLSEVTATISLELSEGFSELVPSIIVVVGYACAFILLSQVLGGAGARHDDRRCLWHLGGRRGRPGRTGRSGVVSMANSEGSSDDERMKIPLE